MKNEQTNVMNYNSELENLKKNNKILVGNIGRLSEQKGIDIFIKAMHQVIKTNHDIYGVIVGDGEDKNKLQDLVKKMNIEKNILFLGYQKNINEIIEQLDFIVLSSRWEGLPLTPIEAFSKGKLVIATNIPGNNEVVIDEKNGLLFEKDNYIMLSQLINDIVLNPIMKKKLENNAKKTYENKYTYDVFLKSYEEVYINL